VGSTGVHSVVVSGLGTVIPFLCRGGKFFFGPPPILVVNKLFLCILFFMLYLFSLFLLNKWCSKLLLAIAFIEYIFICRNFLMCLVLV